MTLQSALELLERSVIYYKGEPVGTAAAADPNPVAANYTECFVRDFVPSALVYLMRGEHDIVRNFLQVVMDLRGQQSVLKGHHRSRGLMPASFRVNKEGGREELEADFGDRAIGRVVPVDSALWWMILLRAYVAVTGDRAFAESVEAQTCMCEILDLYLRESFENTPTLLVPDGAFMIDRRMGVYGFPLEIQALFYGMLMSARQLLAPGKSATHTPDKLDIWIDSLRSYVRKFYWVDRERLNQIHRFKGEEFGYEVENVLNVYPESIPDWLDGWIGEDSGYLAGNKGPGRVDFRFFSQGNLLAILFELATDEEGHAIMNLFEEHREELLGEMPVKIAYPAVDEREWQVITGSDPKNVAWSYHNGGNWPVLIWPFVGAALRKGRLELAEYATQLVDARMEKDNWPEYYDGRKGSLIGRRANFFQVWSATGLIVARELLDNPERSRHMFERFTQVARDSTRMSEDQD